MNKDRMFSSVLLDGGLHRHQGGTAIDSFPTLIKSLLETDVHIVPDFTH